jgi:drug/metabolite transporter (DMT)-like permease
VSRFYLPLLLLLAAIWGASFMFIKVADRELEPATLMEVRIALAGLILLGVLAAHHGAREAAVRLRRAGLQPYLLGIVNAAVPFTLIAWGEKHVDSGVAAIANASMPIFVALLALRFQRSERSSGLRLAGILLGLLGVAVLAGVHPRGGWWAVVGTLAVVGAAVSYAVGSLWAQRLMTREAPLVLTTATMVGAALVLLPLALAQLPASFPGWKTIGSVVALGVAGTAIGTLMYYRLVALDRAAEAVPAPEPPPAV